MALILLSVTLHGWAAGYLARAGYEEREAVLTARGPYRHNRNPYYIAHLAMDLGFFCVAGHPWWYLAYFPVIFWVYRRSVQTEEAYLLEEFGEEYERFCREVPRWGWRLLPAPGRGHEQRWEWSMFQLNREPGRAGGHLLLLVLFVSISFFGNPFDRLSALVRGTIIGTYGIAVLLRDVFPLEPPRKNLLWSLVTASVAVTGVLALGRERLWRSWSEPAAWTALGLGLAIGWVVAFTVLPSFSRWTGKDLVRVYRQPINPWWWILFALGLMSGSWAGLWIGALTALCLWTASLAGWVEIRRPKPRLLHALAIAGAFGLAAILSSWRLAS